MDSETNTEANPAASPDSVRVSDETFDVLRSSDTLLSDLLRRLGALEESYVMSKGKIVEELVFQRRQFDAALNDAAKKHGLDVTKQRWVFNFQTRTFTREG